MRCFYLDEREQLHHREVFDIDLIRWDSLPDFGIYSDQVLSIIEGQLSFLQHPDTERVITPAMINNYVKHGLIERPIKKKYYKLHIAKLIVITLLKQVLPLTDIQKGIALQVSIKGEQEAYDTFCEELEQSFQLIYQCLGKRDTFSFTIDNIQHSNMALKMVTLSLATKLLTQRIILQNGARNLQPTEKGENSFEK